VFVLVWTLKASGNSVTWVWLAAELRTMAWTFVAVMWRRLTAFSLRPGAGRQPTALYPQTERPAIMDQISIKTPSPKMSSLLMFKGTQA
jgi:hypothetical protein